MVVEVEERDATSGDSERPPGSGDIVVVFFLLFFRLLLFLGDFEAEKRFSHVSIDPPWRVKTWWRARLRWGFWKQNSNLNLKSTVTTRKQVFWARLIVDENVCRLDVDHLNIKKDPKSYRIET